MQFLHKSELRTEHYSTYSSYQYLFAMSFTSPSARKTRAPHRTLSIYQYLLATSSTSSEIVILGTDATRIYLGAKGTPHVTAKC